MKKKVLAAFLATAMTMSLTACGGSTEEATTEVATEETAAEETVEETETEEVAEEETEATETEAAGVPAYADIELGTDYTELTASIKVLTNRTDMCTDDYVGTTYAQYIEEFNKLYPNITVEIEGITDYAEDALLRLSSGDWGDVMLIPAVDKNQLPEYFLSYGDTETMTGEVKWANEWNWDGQAYGVATTGDASGIVYNKKVFEEAGITELPATPEAFMEALKAISENTDAIPLYTNYAAGWTMDGQWTPHIAGSATGDSTYMNQKFLHTAAPFSDPGDGTGAYNVYKILYDAVANGYTEDDYTTTDWEGCKGMINNGEIGCMVLGSWAYPQMQQGGPNPDDIGYMPFPITVDGKQYSSSGPNYGYGINVNASEENKIASLIYVKWMTEMSGFAFNEGGIPIAVDDTNYPEVYAAFADIELISNEPALEGEEELLNALNEESELMFNAGGDMKVQAIVEHAANGDMTFDEIMEEWNQKWSDAQVANDVEQLY
ncbi:MAG: extracellular solute-binding protein [Lachnospiraceae bacterium]|nr:extracellular solute-binding protein [Lachnospiraceae bacterium]